MVLKCRQVFSLSLTVWVWGSSPPFHPFTSPSEADFTLTTADKIWKLFFFGTLGAIFAHSLFFYGFSLMLYILICNELENLISVCETDALSISTSGQQPLFVVSRPQDAAGSSVCVRVCPW